MTDGGANWLGLGALGLLIVGFGLAFLALYILPERRAARAMDALAARRGWRVMRHNDPGQGHRVQITPVDVAAQWECTVTLWRNGATTIRKTEYHAPFAAPIGGMVVIGPPLASSEATMAATLLGNAGPGLLALLLGPEEAPSAANLQPVDGPQDMTVFADAHADTGPLIAGLRAGLQGWTGEAPIVIARPGRVRLRLRTDAIASGQIAPLIDLGNRLSAE